MKGEDVVGQGWSKRKRSCVKADLSFRSNNYLLKAKDALTVIVVGTTDKFRFLQTNLRVLRVLHGALAIQSVRDAVRLP